MLLTVITMLPLVALAGTVASTDVLAQLVTVAATPLNVIVLDPCAAPNALPLIVTVEPVTPEVGDRLAILGVAVKNEILLEAPLTVTITCDDPGPRPTGTVTPMLPILQLETLAAIPAKVTVLELWFKPKLLPVMVIAVPTGPEISDRLVITGVTVKVAILLVKPLTVTAMLSFPAGTLGTLKAMLPGAQLVRVIALPPKLTVLVP